MPPTLSHNDEQEQGCVLALGHPQVFQHSVTAHSPQVTQEAVEGVCVLVNQVTQLMLQVIGVKGSGRTLGRYRWRLHPKMSS